jgi:signal peptidase I
VQQNVVAASARGVHSVSRACIEFIPTNEKLGGRMEQVDRRQWPAWVRIGLWGVPNRTTAWAFFWFCLAVGIACIAFGFVDRRFFGGGALFLAALWYYASIHWVDQRGALSAMPSVSTTRKIVLGSVIAIALALFAIKKLFISDYRIPQNGMYPGLPAGSHIFAAKRAYSNSSSVERGDIVVFVREENGQRYNYIWRVVALPGEKVEASGESLSINGQAVQRQRLRQADGKTVFREQIGEASYEVAFNDSPRHTPPDVSITVPADQFFVMGDNRYDSRDSRYFGPIHFSSIIGRKL